MNMTDEEREEYFGYLDDLRASGVCNMYAARRPLRDEFPELDKRDAGDVLAEWMHTYTERHP